MPTEIIAAVKQLPAGGKLKTDMILVTTNTGNKVWCPKSQFDESAETITFDQKKKGDTYTTKDGAQGVLSSDRNEFIGHNKQVVRKYTTLEVMDHLISKGITPTFAV